MCLPTLLGLLKLDSMFLWDGGREQSYSLMNKAPPPTPWALPPAQLGSRNLGPKENQVDHVLSRAFPLFDSFKNKARESEFGMKFILKSAPSPNPGALFTSHRTQPLRALRAWQKPFPRRDEIFEITQKEREGVDECSAQSSPQGVLQK